jgi:hypothetical protein
VYKGTGENIVAYVDADLGGVKNRTVGPALAFCLSWQELLFLGNLESNVLSPCRVQKQNTWL